MNAADVPAKYRDHWRRPWTAKARRSIGFRRWLARHHLFTPHFSYAEMACKDAARTPVPRALRSRMRNHCFRLERFRHECGDIAMPAASGYRTIAHNRAVHGARFSRHVQCDATDFTKATVDRVGRTRWFATAERVFSNGGVGDYPGGAAHLDSRGVKARWRSFVGQ
jgi:hypothetical protein